MGKPDKVAIRCDTDTRRRWKKVVADVDPDADYEDVLLLFIKSYEKNPERHRQRYRDKYW